MKTIKHTAKQPRSEKKQKGTKVGIDSLRSSFFCEHLKTVDKLKTAIAAGTSHQPAGFLRCIFFGYHKGSFSSGLEKITRRGQKKYASKNLFP